MLSLMNTSIKSALSKHNLRKFKIVLIHTELTFVFPPSENKCIPNLFEGWKKLSARIQKIRKDLHKPRSSFAFSFVEVRLCIVVEQREMLRLNICSGCLGGSRPSWPLDSIG